MLTFAYEVIEHYGDDNPPELFGGYVGGPDVKAGDKIQLKWLDGRDAYEVVVRNRDGVTLHVEAAVEPAPKEGTP
jgi:hypothetical protein